MGQTEVLEFLKNNPDKWFRIKEIKTGASIASVNICLVKLRKYHLLDFKTAKIGKFGQLHYMYKHKGGG